MRLLAIDIGGTKFQAALFENNRIVAKETRFTDRAAGPEPMIAELIAIARRWRFERCGVGFGGPVDFARQRVALSTHAGGWTDFPLAERLQSALGVPVVIDNDANAGALGEARFGAGRDHLPMFYMTLSTGIGGGIVLESGELYRGADSWAGELGHIAIRPDGPECLCGARGCFERICCGLWLERDYGKPVRELLGDASFTRRYAADLAAGLKAAVMLLNPARIVIGGGIAKSGDALFVPLRAELRRQVTAWSRARLDVQPAALGDDSVLWGAAILAS
ncbi:MAG TPA: ROK family protein [Bryobacteraceae bacterium]|jgi:glucokinase|nr:ROK family protein [Bryobacteraceae bacterium]